MTTTASMGPARPSPGQRRPAASARQPAPAVRKAAEPDIIDEIFEGADKREKFLPMTRQALMDRLTRESAWPLGEAGDARRFFRYLDHWRHQTYNARLQALEKSYEPFSPDSDLLVTRQYTQAEKDAMQKRLVTQVTELVTQANFAHVDPANVELILTPDSHYGLDLEVDLGAFDELAIFYRGATRRKAVRRNVKKLYLTKEEFDVPIFQRLFILFKLKPEERRVRELMAEKGWDRETADKRWRRMKALLPPQISTDYVYLKLFKNIPRSDLEMIFPNTRVRFRLFDKLKLGVTTSGSVGMGVVGAVGKIAVASNPVTLAGAVVGLGGLALRQAMNFVNQRNRYMVTMAQNLYFHAMGDNRSVMTLLADRAAEEDIKEEMLLYSVVAKERVHVSELPEVDRAIEGYLLGTFGIDLNFDVEDAFRRLVADGIVTTGADGYLQALSPADAASHIDKLWDAYLDHLPGDERDEGVELRLGREKAAGHFHPAVAKAS